MCSYNMRMGVNAVIVKDGKILLISFEDASTGFHYNLPGGGVEPGESLTEALKCEAWDEAREDIDVGKLLLVTEYEPRRNAARYGELHKLGLIFACQLKAAGEPHLPQNPDPNQVGVVWIRLEELVNVLLLPHIAAPLLAAYQQGEGIDGHALTYWSVND